MVISLALGCLFYLWRWPRRYLASSAWLAFNCLVVVLALKPDFPVWLQGAILLIALGLAAVSYWQWVRWTARLWLWIVAVSVAFLWLATAISYGPF